MKKWMLGMTAGAALMTALGATAATPQTTDGHGTPREAIYQSWSLNAQQQAQIDSADRAFRERMDTLSQQTFDTDQGRRKAMRDAVKQHRQALNATLDERQVRVLKALDQRAAPGHAKKALMTSLFASWKLDQTQIQAIDDARQAMRQDLRALRQDSTAKDSREGRRQAMDEIVERQRARLSRVLSPEQIHVLAMMRHVELRGPMGRPPIDLHQALIESWQLDQSQLDAIKKARQTFHQQMSPSDKRHGASDSTGDSRQQRQEAAQTLDQALADVLNPAQMAALKSITHSGRHSMGPGHHGQPPHTPSSSDASAADQG
ncbi:hypothetical protein GCM10010082_01980 [Kushneria pakistanensis]|uniref:LTXXQ motif family protein n=1 Tax=Kushneria pakistanensis TaxID=1508770 RepID=A0ABQ3FA25_9GAMM|nr:hypothetical protein [Kushneria pakistanensis]GHC15108.1 hypothetical protein GCM10010082_01980 [Kushneria pakistanensis]